MKLDEEKEFDLIVNSIAEASKHSRNLLFLLIASSLYVLITAFSNTASNELLLPVFGVTVATKDFFAVSPIVIVAVFLYLHIYVGQLARRLQKYDELTIDLDTNTFSPDPRIYLFPWILTFSEFAREPRYFDKTNQLQGYSKTIKIRVSENLNRVGPLNKFAPIISNLLIWYLGPLVLVVIWIQFLAQHQLISVIPALCLVIALGILFSEKYEKLQFYILWIFSSTIIMLSNFAVVPSYRSAIGLDAVWAPLKLFLTILKLNEMSQIFGTLINFGLWGWLTLYIALAAFPSIKPQIELPEDSEIDRISENNFATNFRKVLLPLALYLFKRIIPPIILVLIFLDLFMLIVLGSS